MSENNSMSNEGKKSKKLYYYGSAIILLIVLVSVIFYVSGNKELKKVYTSLNAQNYDFAVGKLKEILYEDENNNEAKGLLIYAQTRKYLEEHRIITFDGVLRISLSNLIRIRDLTFQNTLYKLGYLRNKEREEFLQTSKDLRQQLTKYGVPTENMDEVAIIFKEICNEGSKLLKLSQGDEVDQALYSYILAGNAFFGDNSSAEKLIKLSKMNPSIKKIFGLSGTGLVENLYADSKNDQSLIGDESKLIVAKYLLREEIKNLFEKNNTLVSAVLKLIENNSKAANEIYYHTSFMGNSIFYDPILFDDFLQYIEKNNKAGIDVSIDENNDLIELYYFDPSANKFITNFYRIIDNELKPIIFSDKTTFSFELAPATISNFDRQSTALTIIERTYKKQLETKSEEIWNPKKYYSSYTGYTGGYDYKQVSYEVEVPIRNYVKYNLNNNKASLIKVE